MLLFSLWKEDELKEFIMTIEMAIGSGAMTVQTPQGGGQSFRSLADMYTTLRNLYSALGRLDKQDYRTSTRPRQVEAIFRNGYTRGRRRSAFEV